MSKTKCNIVEEYIHYYDKYVSTFGINTIILMQVGSFHEAYSTDDEGPSLEKIESKSTVL